MSITKTLLLLNVLVFIVELSVGEGFIDRFALWPFGSAHFQLHQFITYAFLHASLLHIGFNMLSLWMFGGRVEEEIGASRFLLLYFTAVISGALLQLLILWLAGVISSPTVGASAGVFGLLVAFAMYFPKEKVIFLLLPIPMPAWIFIILYVGMELFLGFSGGDPGTSHWGHIGGALGAVLLILFWRFMI